MSKSQRVPVPTGKIAILILLFGTVQVRELSTAAHCRAAGIVPELIHTDLLSSLCWIGDQEGVIEHRMHVSPRRPIAVSESL